MKLALFALAFAAVQAVPPQIVSQSTTTTTTTTSIESSSTSTAAATTTTAGPRRCGSGVCYDSCARDLLEYQESGDVVVSDCKAFLHDVVVTVAPDTTWVTSYVATDVVTISASSTTEVISVSIVPRDLPKRVITIEVIPPYASDCVNEQQYSSACSCYGVTPSTVSFQPAPVTSTISLTTTSTVTARISIQT